MTENRPAVRLHSIYTSRMSSFSDDFDVEQQSYTESIGEQQAYTESIGVGPVARRRSSLNSARTGSIIENVDPENEVTVSTSEEEDAEDMNEKAAALRHPLSSFRLAKIKSNMSRRSLMIGDDFDDQKSDHAHAHDDDKESLDLLQLPESTYSLFFTESPTSLPFLFAVIVSLLSFGCLWLSFFNNVIGGTAHNPLKIPPNVSTTVRVAQYLSILIAVLMEEEIPTGLFLLRVSGDFIQRFPSIQRSSYSISALVRMFSGYSFLINVFIVLIQADGVVEIFYDVLALQFVQQLDDIVFHLAKIGTLGERMQRACTSGVFKVCLKKHPSSCKRSDGILKALYFVNLWAFLAGMLVLSTRQAHGYYNPMVTAKAAPLSVGSVISGQVTIDQVTGKIISENEALPARDIDPIKLYNSHVTESSVVLVNVADSGGCEPVVYQALPSSGEVNIKVKNFGETACTSAYTLAFWVMDGDGDGDASFKKKKKFKKSD